MGREERLSGVLCPWQQVGSFLGLPPQFRDIRSPSVSRVPSKTWIRGSSELDNQGITSWPCFWHSGRGWE